MCTKFIETTKLTTVRTGGAGPLVRHRSKDRPGGSCGSRHAWMSQKYDLSRGSLEYKYPNTFFFRQPTCLLVSQILLLIHRLFLMTCSSFQSPWTRRTICLRETLSLFSCSGEPPTTSLQVYCSRKSSM